MDKACMMPKAHLHEQRNPSLMSKSFFRAKHICLRFKANQKILHSDKNEAVL